MDDDPILAAIRMAESAQQTSLQPSATPLQDAIDRLGDHGEGFELDVGRDQAGHAGVKAEVSKDLGKGWSVGAAASWVKDMGYAAWGKVKWSPKSK
jgi:hypothetical protein